VAVAVAVRQVVNSAVTADQAVAVEAVTLRIVEHQERQTPVAVAVVCTS
jgi:hypothetical protein